MNQDHVAQPTFDRVYSGLDGLPGIKSVKPSTVVSSLPIIGTTVTYVVQTIKTSDMGFTLFVQVVDAEGRARLVIPNKVCQAIYRQRQALTDRSTPQSRAATARKRARKAQKTARARKGAQNSPKVF